MDTENQGGFGSGMTSSAASDSAASGVARGTGMTGLAAEMERIHAQELLPEDPQPDEESSDEFPEESPEDLPVEAPAGRPGAPEGRPGKATGMPGGRPEMPAEAPKGAPGRAPQGQPSKLPSERQDATGVSRRTRTLTLIAASLALVLLVMMTACSSTSGPHHGFYSLEDDPAHGFLIYTEKEDGANEAVLRDSLGKIWKNKVYTWTVDDDVVTMKLDGFTCYKLRYDKDTDTLHDITTESNGEKAISNGYVYKFSSAMTSDLM